jgi:hypothetical protein
VIEEEEAMTNRLTTLRCHCVVIALLSTAGLAACGTEPNEGADVETLPQATGSGAPYFQRIAGSLVNISSQQDRNSSVNCPAGGIAIGGGIYGNSSRLMLIGSYRTGTSQWSVDVRNLGASSSYQVFATCLMDADQSKVTVVEGPSQLVKPGNTGSSWATCPANRALIGGGWAVWGWGGEKMEPTDSFAQLQVNGWYAQAHNDGNVDANVWSEAICYSDSSSIDADTTYSGISVPGGGGGGTVTVTCPSQRWATAGGFQVPQDFNIYRSRGTTDGGWYTRATNNQSQSKWYEARVLCVKFR